MFNIQLNHVEEKADELYDKLTKMNIYVKWDSLNGKQVFDYN